MKTLHLSIIAILILFFSFSIFPVLGDCFAFCDKNPPQSLLAGRIPVVTVKFYPDSIIPTSQHYLWFRFYDTNTNETFQNVTFWLTITKQDHPLFKDLFYAQPGTLTMKVISINDSKNTIVGQQDPVQGAWEPQEEGNPVILYAPMLNDANTTYHLDIQMVTVDYQNLMFESPNIPTFNFNLDTKEQNQTLTSQNTISKYLSDHNDSSTLQSSTTPEFSFAIPTLIISITSLIIFYRIKIKS